MVNLRSRRKSQPGSIPLDETHAHTLGVAVDRKLGTTRANRAHRFPNIGVASPVVHLIGRHAHSHDHYQTESDMKLVRTGQFQPLPITPSKMVAFHASPQG